MSGEYKYSHLSEDLHVEIQTFAPPAEAHARIAYALAEVRRFLVPVSNFHIKRNFVAQKEKESGLMKKSFRGKRHYDIIHSLGENSVPIRVSIQFNSISFT